MDASVASGSGQLHFQEAFLRGHGGRRAYIVRNIAMPLCMQKELSWLQGKSQVVQNELSRHGEQMVHSSKGTRASARELCRYLMTCSSSMV